MLPGDLLYEMSSWTRSILVPLSIVQARGSNRRPPAGSPSTNSCSPAPACASQGEGPFGAVSPPRPRLQALEKRGPERIRNFAIREAEHWILDRTRHTRAWAPSTPP